MPIDLDIYCGSGSSLTKPAGIIIQATLLSPREFYVNYLSPVVLCYLSKHFCGVRHLSKFRSTEEETGLTVTPTPLTWLTSAGWHFSFSKWRAYYSAKISATWQLRPVLFNETVRNNNGSLVLAWGLACLVCFSSAVSRAAQSK